MFICVIIISLDNWLFLDIFKTQHENVFPLSFVQVPSTDRNALSSLWGKLASEILMQNWEAAMEDLTRLRETIDNNVCK